jgi:hypothetical protein
MNIKPLRLCIKLDRLTKMIDTVLVPRNSRVSYPARGLSFLCVKAERRQQQGAENYEQDFAKSHGNSDVDLLHATALAAFLDPETHDMAFNGGRDRAGQQAFIPVVNGSQQIADEAVIAAAVAAVFITFNI